MAARNAICIIVDGLRASALGTYGNTWYPTPALDRLAARSTVADWLWSDSLELRRFYRGLWYRAHALQPDPMVQSVSVPRLLAGAGLKQSLVTDDPWLRDEFERLSIADSHWLELGQETAADAIEQTAMGHLFAEVIGQLERLQPAHEPYRRPSAAETPGVGDDRLEVKQSPGRFMLWVHSRGMHGPWDAPLPVREDLVGADDLAPPTWVEPPSMLRGDDPDLWFGIRVAYAAQMIVLDACIGALLAALDQMRLAESTLVMLAGARGFALGEHQVAGTECRDLVGTQLHLPLLVAVPGTSGPPARFTHLVQPADLGATLLDWFESEQAATAPAANVCAGKSLWSISPVARTGWRQLAVARGLEGELAVRTPAWMLRQMAPDANRARADSALPTELTMGQIIDGQHGAVQLFAKPDDRWDANDISRCCPDVTSRLLALLAEFEGQCNQAGPVEINELDDDLIAPHR
jgi:sulfatase-like protein